VDPERLWTRGFLHWTPRNRLTKRIGTLWGRCQDTHGACYLDTISHRLTRKTRMHARVHASIAPVLTPLLRGMPAGRGVTHTHRPVGPGPPRAAPAPPAPQTAASRCGPVTQACVLERRLCAAPWPARVPAVPRCGSRALWRCPGTCSRLACACTHAPQPLRLQQRHHLEQLHIAKLGLNSKLAPTNPVSMSMTTLLATGATASKSARVLREELGT